jgi:hypothetical protein
MAISRGIERLREHVHTADHGRDGRRLLCVGRHSRILTGKSSGANVGVLLVNCEPGSWKFGYVQLTTGRRIGEDIERGKRR